MKVKEVMETKVITIKDTATYEEAAAVLHNSRISGAPVVDKDGNVVGLISEKDLLRVLYPYYQSYAEHPEAYLDYEARENKIEEIRKRPIDKFMTKQVTTIDPTTPVLKAGGIMLAHGFHRLPVIEDGKLIGIVTREHIYKGILKSHLGF
jgi:CBS domain-containing protein